MSGNLFSGSKAVLFSRTVNAARYDEMVQKLLLELDSMAGDPTQLAWMPLETPSGLSPEDLTVDKLKDYLRRWKLSTSGSKKNLIARFKQYQENEISKSRSSSSAENEGFIEGKNPEDNRFALEAELNSH